MILKWIGAVFIVVSCGGFGYYLVRNHLKEEHSLREVISALDYMGCELQYHLTPLPQLCRQTAAECNGVLRTCFLLFAQELEDQISPDVYTCMHAAIVRTKGLTALTCNAMDLLGKSLGRFDIDGQLKGLEAVRQSCRRSLEKLNANRDTRLRGYQTLALCAGAALVILFL